MMYEYVHKNHWLVVRRSDFPKGGDIVCYPDKGDRRWVLETLMIALPEHCQQRTEA
jgi:hypothetical protein